MHALLDKNKDVQIVECTTFIHRGLFQLEKNMIQCMYKPRIIFFIAGASPCFLAYIYQKRKITKEMTHVYCRTLKCFQFIIINNTCCFTCCFNSQLKRGRSKGRNGAGMGIVRLRKKRISPLLLNIFYSVKNPTISGATAFRIY